MIDPAELPDPEDVADELATLSRKHNDELTSREHATLNAADHWLRYVLADNQEDT